MLLLESALQDPSSQYLIRWPPWVGFLIAIGIVGGPYSLLVAWVRRALGPIGLVALAGLVSLLFAVIIMEEWRREPSIGGVDLVLATAACIVAFAVAPAVTIWLKSRGPAPASMGKQAGWALLSIYGTFGAMIVLMVLVLVVFRLV